MLTHRVGPSPTSGTQRKLTIPGINRFSHIMQFTVAPEIFQLYPELTLGILIAKNIDNTKDEPEIIGKIQTEEERIKTQYNRETFATVPAIAAWRSAYLQFGVKQKDARSSVENLYRSVMNGRNTHHINTVVDIYNYISLKYMVPAGGESLDVIQGDIKLTRAANNEPQALMLGETAPESPTPGEVFYKDSISAICRRFNWREAERTKLTPETRNYFLIIETIPPSVGLAQTALNELEQLCLHFCGGIYQKSIVNKEHFSLDIVT